MKRRVFFLLILLHLFYYVKADAIWPDKKWQITHQQDAVYYRIDDAKNNFRRIIYTLENHKFFMACFYNDSSFSKRSGPFVWYDHNGRITDSILYNDDRIIRLQHFHANGKPKTLLIYGNSSRAV